jgi:hypothetical protein
MPKSPGITVEKSRFCVRQTWPVMLPQREMLSMPFFTKNDEGFDVYDPYDLEIAQNLAVKKKAHLLNVDRHPYFIEGLPLRVYKFLDIS